MTDKVLEGRTIHNLDDLRDFLDAAISAARIDHGQRVDYDLIRLEVPVDMRLVRETLTDGSRVYNISSKVW